MKPAMVQAPGNDNGAGLHPDAICRASHPISREADGTQLMTSILADQQSAAKVDPGQTSTPVPAKPPTLDYLFETPLDTLTAEFNVTILTSEITDAGFFGASVVRSSSIAIMLSKNLGEFERDFFPRYLLAQAFRLNMTPLPTPFEVEIHPLLPGVPA